MIRTGSITSSERTATSPHPQGRAPGRSRSTAPFGPNWPSLTVAAELSMGVDARPEGPLASLGHVTKGELCREQALVFWCGPPSGTTHYPTFIILTCRFIRADRHVSPDFASSRQVGDLEPELVVDGCLHGGVSVADDFMQVAEADDEGTDVVFGELAAGLAGVAGQRGGAFRLDLPGPPGDGFGSAPASRAAWCRSRSTHSSPAHPASTGTRRHGSG
jgi:hypothetical protein